MNRIVAHVCLIALPVLVPSLAYGGLKISQMSGQGENKTALSKFEKANINLERDKVAFERERFEFEKQIENKKIAVGRLTAWLMAVSIFIPLLIGVLTAYYAVRNRDKQAKSMFALSAAGIVMNATNSFDLVSKAKTLRVLFPEQLPEGFITAIENLEVSK